YGKAFPGSDQEDLNLIKAKEAWDLDSGGANIILGLTDAWVHRNHRDLTGKADNTYPNAPQVGNLEHGVMTSGVLAAHTNNDTGLSSISYLCRMRNAAIADSNVLKMSKDGLRIISNSWLDTSAATGCQTTLNFS